MRLAWVAERIMNNSYPRKLCASHLPFTAIVNDSSDIPAVGGDFFLSEKTTEIMWCNSYKKNLTCDNVLIPTEGTDKLKPLPFLRLQRFQTSACDSFQSREVPPPSLFSLSLFKWMPVWARIQCKTSNTYPLSHGIEL